MDTTVPYSSLDSGIHLEGPSMSPYQSLEKGSGKLPQSKSMVTPTSGGYPTSVLILIERVFRVRLQVCWGDGGHGCIDMWFYGVCECLRVLMGHCGLG